MTHSAITGSSCSKIQFHSQQSTRHYCGNKCGCAEYKDRVMGHIWTSHIHRPPQAIPCTYGKGKDVDTESSFSPQACSWIHTYRIEVLLCSVCNGYLMFSIIFKSHITDDVHLVSVMLSFSLSPHLTVNTVVLKRGQYKLFLNQ